MIHLWNKPSYNRSPHPESYPSWGELPYKKATGVVRVALALEICGEDLQRTGEAIPGADMRHLRGIPAQQIRSAPCANETANVRWLSGPQIARFSQIADLSRAAGCCSLQ
jgi:hypothetical protein